jgi:hypothetical protein
MRLKHFEEGIYRGYSLIHPMGNTSILGAPPNSDDQHFVGAPPREDDQHFVGAPPSGRFFVVCEGDRDEGVAPTRGLPAFCRSPALGAILCGLRGFSRRGRRSYKGAACIL